MNRPNVLFMPVDDLRPQLACYGRENMITPCLDGLAGDGVLFRQAYCQVPVCGATRASLLTGVRPTPTRFLDFATWADEDIPGARTLPQHFRESGYETVAVGKVFHHAPDTAERSWSRTVWQPERKAGWRDYLLPENIAVHRENHRAAAPYECADVDDDAYADGKIADRAIAEIHRLAEGDAPFFLAAGFLKPHLPFNAPKRYWDRYDADAVDPADNPYAPENCPDEALHDFGELRAYFGVPKEGPLPDDLAQTLVHGYYAATSYMDAQIGRVVTALDDLGLRENTVIVVWGDHGWQLGEHGLWCKHCNFDTSLHAPLIINAPDGARDRACDGIAEFLDIYPTLCDLADIDIPPHVQGESLLETVGSPEDGGKEAAFSRYHAAESVRSGRHLYTEFLDEDGSLAARMLYDHDSDADENVNIAEHPDQAETVSSLSAMLASHRDGLS